MTIAKQDEAESIRREYKAKMVKLREFYEQKLRKLNAKKAAAAGTTATASTATAPTSPTIQTATAPVETTSLQGEVAASAPAANDLGTSTSTEAPVTEPVIRLKNAPTPAETPERIETTEPELAI
jgi:uncharacterized protein (DUF2062 family)